MPVTQRTKVTLLVLSAAGLVGILVNEGFRQPAYTDTVGVPTIGFGTTEGVKMGDRITVEKALIRALTDVSKFEGALKKCVKVPLSQNEYDAYIDFSYNIGSTAFCNSTLVKKLNREDYAGACAEISRWIKQPELIPRRQRERALCEDKGLAKEVH